MELCKILVHYTTLVMRFSHTLVVCRVFHSFLPLQVILSAKCFPLFYFCLTDSRFQINCWINILTTIYTTFFLLNVCQEKFMGCNTFIAAQAISGHKWKHRIVKVEPAVIVIWRGITLINRWKESTGILI